MVENPPHGDALTCDCEDNPHAIQNLQSQLIENFSRLIFKVVQDLRSVQTTCRRRKSKMVFS